ncbi:MAG: MFS transporter [Clostridiales bacterium]|nr:MFS transporter [Clostridiales bacterium]
MGMKEKLAEMKYKVTHNPSFTIKEQIGYSAGIFGNSMGQDAVMTYTDKFVREYTGVSAGRMTLMSNILTISGLIIAPLAGNLYDTPVPEGKKMTPTKWAMLLTPIPFAISSMLLFVIPSANALVNFLWVIISHWIFNTVDAFYDMSLTTTSLRMTTNAKDRKNFYTIATLASSLGSMLPGWLIPIVVDTTDDVNRQKMLYFIVALVFCVLGVTSMFAPYFTLNEKIRVVERPKKTSFNWDRESISTLFHCPSILIVFIGNLFEQIRSNSYTVLPYIYDEVLDQYSLKSLIDMLSGTLSYAGLAAVPFITNHFSPRVVMFGGYAYTGFFYAIMGLLGLKFDVTRLRKLKYLIGVIIGVAGMPNNAEAAAKKVIIGDATDYMEWYSEKRYGVPIRSDGLVSAAQSIFGTLCSFVKNNVYNISFKKTNYKAKKMDPVTGKLIAVTQTDSTLHGIYLIFILCGVIGNFCAAIAYLFDRFSGKRREAILAELAVMREKRGIKEADIKSELSEETVEAAETAAGNE